MPIHRFMQPLALDAAAAKVITTAFDDAVRDLGLQRTDPKAEIVARKVIEGAQLGQRDPARLREFATAAFWIVD